MDEHKALELKSLQKEIIRVAIIDALGTLLMGLAIYAKFASNGEPFHPILNDESVIMGMFIAGGAIMLWGVSRVIAISRRRKELQNN